MVGRAVLSFMFMVHVGILFVPPVSLGASPSAMHCTLNAAASRRHDERSGWSGPVPRWGQRADRSIAFEIASGAEATTKAVLFSGFIFSQLETNTPHVQAIVGATDSNGQRLEGYPRQAMLIQRSSRAVFFLWEAAADEFYTAAIHFKSRKAAINGVSSGFDLYSVGASAWTADCE